MGHDGRSGIKRTAFQAALRIPGILIALPCMLAARPSVGRSTASRDCREKIENARVANESSPREPHLELQLARALSSCSKPAAAVPWYRDYLRAEPRQAGVWYELGEVLSQAHRPGEAAQAFRRMLEIAPGNADGELGLAQALAAADSNGLALKLYDKVLAAHPANYDALQGKGLILYRTRQFQEAAAIFRELVKTDPKDQENQEILGSIVRAQEAERWQKLNPPPGSPPEAIVGYSLSYLADHPQDRATLKVLAMAEARLKNYPAAIGAEKYALRLNPQDREAQGQLALILSWDHQYGASIEVYEEMLEKSPEDQEALKNLARVYAWSKNWQEALRTEEKLLTLDPQNDEVQLSIARIEIRFKDHESAQKNLAAILSRHPQEHEARLDLARLELRDGQLHKALEDFSYLFGSNFQDPDALYGAARIYYYLGNPDRARPLAEALVRLRPTDFEALMLLARIERAEGDQKPALKLLHRAARLRPGNPAVAGLRAQMHRSGAVILHTSASYAREVSFRGPFVSERGFEMPGRDLEDLNSYSGEAKISFKWLPRSLSYVLLAAMPSNSPMGGIQGAVAPAEFLYGQTTQVSRSLTLRGGIGLARMGPGELFGLTGESQPLETLGITPVGYFGYSFSPNRKLRLSLTVSRTAIAYTPTSVRFGARQTRIEAGVRYAFNSRTSLSAILYHDRDFSALYDHVRLDLGGETVLERNGRDNGNGGTLAFTRNLIRGERFALDAGYSGLAFGYAGERRGVFMGFFNPAFYQQHLATSHVYGQLCGPVGYDFIADIGVQQSEEAAPFTRAFRVGPRLSFRLSPRVMLTLGYLHYDFAQSLGSIKGNAVSLSTDWRF